MPQTISNTSAGSSIKSEQNIALVARNEDISIRGSRVDAGRCRPSAADVKFAASQIRADQPEPEPSSGYSVGVLQTPGRRVLALRLILRQTSAKESGKCRERCVREFPSDRRAGMFTCSQVGIRNWPAQRSMRRTSPCRLAGSQSRACRIGRPAVLSSETSGFPQASPSMVPRQATSRPALRAVRATAIILV